MTLTTGLELELWVVDEDGQLADGRDVADAHDRIEPEFVAPLIEVRTKPEETERGLRRDLGEVLVTAIRAAAASGQRLVPLATALTASEEPAQSERGELFETVYGDGVRAAKNCAGTHVHFERDETCRQLNALTALDPALALVSSAPYYRGERVQNSARANAYRRLCGSRFTEFCDLWPYVDSVDEWEARVDRAFELFVSLAVERGVSRDRVEAAFAPEDAVLNPVRLRESQPTVEWRAPDAALPSKVIALAMDVRRVVEQTTSKPVAVGEPGLSDDHIGVPEFETVRGLSRAAIAFGLSPEPVRNYLERFEFDPSAYRPLAPRVAGADTLDDERARELRLRQAGRLEADVASLQGLEPGAASLLEQA